MPHRLTAAALLAAALAGLALWAAADPPGLRAAGPAAVRGCSSQDADVAFDRLVGYLGPCP